MLFRHYSSRAKCLVLLWLIPLSLFAQSVPLDFDGDGISDPGLTERQSDGSANEIVFELLLSESSAIEHFEFGKRTDLEVHGNYSGGDHAEVAVARRADDEDVVWRVRGSSNQEVQEVAFGLQDDSVVGGCDANADGQADLSVLRDGAMHFRSLTEDAEESIPLEGVSGKRVVDLQCAKNPEHAVAFLALTEDVLEGDVASQGKRWRRTCRQRFGANRSRRAKCRARRKAIRDKEKEEEPISEPEPTEPMYSVLAFDRQGNKLISLESKKLPLMLEGSSTEGEQRIAILVKQKGGMKLRLLDDAGEEVLESDLPFKVEDAVLASFDGAGSHVILAKSKGSGLFLVSLDDGSSLPAEFGLSGEALVHVGQFHRYISSAEEDPNGLCDEFRDPNDGAGGFLFKPDSDEHANQSVILFPGSDRTRYESVRLMRSGEVLASYYFSSLANPDSNGLRQHWRFDRSGSSFGKNVIVVAEGRNGSGVCYRIENPAVRVD